MKMFHTWLYFPAVISVLAIVANQAEDSDLVSIKLPLGSVIGSIKSYKGKTYSAFQGIPYAQPPVGKLRFLPPQPLDQHWETEMDATKDYTSECAQLSRQDGSVIGTEDCLYINVFSPRNNLQEGGELLPVLVWIHGGAFLSGSTGFYGPQYFMETQRVVMVHFTYRLGSLGFLSLDDDVISGNQGLKDQTEALRWVQKNIKSFGGDPNKVTIFGESAGGVSVAAHVLSPWSSGLFQKAIIQSGGIVDSAFLHLSQNPAFYANQFVEELGIDPEATSEEILDFLQSRSVEEIVEKNHFFETSLYTGNPWVPVKDDFAKNPFFPGDFTQLLSEGKFNKVPILLGTTLDEGAMYIPQFLNNPDFLDEFNSNFDNHASAMWLGIDESDVTEQDVATVNIILREYLPGPDYNITRGNLRQLQDIFTDIIFIHPNFKQTKLLNDNMDHPVYFYSYRYQSKLTLPTLLMGVDPNTDFDFGVCHADELFPMFYQEELEPLKSPLDLAVGSKLIDYWIKFSSEGAPDPAWTPVSKEENFPSYAILDSKPLRMLQEKSVENRMKFLNGIFEVHESYRNFNFLEHPAIIQRLRDREEELMEEAQEAQQQNRDEL